MSNMNWTSVRYHQERDISLIYDEMVDAKVVVQVRIQKWDGPELVTTITFQRGDVERDAIGVWRLLVVNMLEGI